MTLYRRLGVSPDAGVEDIDAAYDRASAALPSDPHAWALRTGVLAWRRWQLARAHRVLRDPASRRAYDAGLSMIEALGRYPPGLL